LIGASPPLSSLLHEEPSIDALNALRLGVSSVGNHEFDQGAAELTRMQRGGCHPQDGCAGGVAFAGARFQYLAANVIRSGGQGSPQTLFPPTAVRKIGGVRIGFIGEVLQGTPTIVRPSGVAGLTFREEADTANRYAAELKRQGVNAIVLLIHKGATPAQPPDRGDPNTCEGLHETAGQSFLPMLERLTPDIKVVISAHTHQAYNCTIGGRLVTSAASNGRVITRITLTIDRATDSIVEARAHNDIVTREVPKDPAETAILDRYRPLVTARTERVVGTVTAPLLRQRSPSGEFPLGDVIADAQLAFANAAGDRAELGFMNPGGVRADITGEHDAGARRGEVTYGDVLVVQPFGNIVEAATMSGEMIRQVLEQQFHADGSSTILQVTDGFTYTYRRNAAAGAHVIAESMMLHGRQLTPDMRVRVSTMNFLLDGGDGFPVFLKATDRQSYGPDADALAAYIAAHSPVAPPPAARITAQ